MLTTADIFRYQGVSDSDILKYGGPKRGADPISWGKNAYCDWHYRQMLYARNNPQGEYIVPCASTPAEYLARPWKYAYPDPGPCPTAAIHNDCGGSFDPGPLIIAVGGAAILAPAVLGASGGGASAVTDATQVTAESADASASATASATEIAPEFGVSSTEEAATVASNVAASVADAVPEAGMSNGFDLGTFAGDVGDTAQAAATNYANSQIGRLFGSGAGSGANGAVQGAPAGSLGFSTGANGLVFVIIGLVVLVLLLRK